ncbi:unnamed protein product [marine sediment metagenome]|uniref:Uncharacterized protein n=1 Tax=marine sediment metagenome TaxID=412755 RepID=X0YD94_9ZZZZ
MSFSRKAGSQAGWALIAGGVNAARVEAHRLHQHLNKILDLVEKSAAKEHLYQVAGDLIVNFPKGLDRLESQLDETGYALATMGKDHLRDRLPISRRNVVDETVEGARGFGVPMMRQTAARVAERHMALRVARRHAGRE